MTSSSELAGTPPLAAHSIDEFALSIPDLEEGRRFFSAFGLTVHDERAGLGLYTLDNPHRWALLLPGSRKRLLWLSLGVHAHDMSSFQHRLERLGIPRIPAPEGASADGLWIEGPGGLKLQLRVAAKVSPSAPAPVGSSTPQRNAGRAPLSSQRPVVHPRYLSHVLLFVPDVDEALDFFSRVIGWRLSDRSGSVIAFMHTPHGSDHHLVAFAKSSGSGYHHSSWCVGSLDEVGLGSQQMMAAGYPDGWGLGRHVLGSNYFRYVKDPWGSFAEYSYDIDYVPAGCEWPAGDHAPDDSLYLWGPPPPVDFVVNHES